MSKVQIKNRDDWLDNPEFIEEGKDYKKKETITKIDDDKNITTEEKTVTVHVTKAEKRPNGSTVIVYQFKE